MLAVKDDLQTVQKLDNLLSVMWKLSSQDLTAAATLPKERIVSAVAQAIKSIYRINVVDMDWDCPTYVGELENRTPYIQYENCFVISYDNIRVMYDNAKKYHSENEFVKNIEWQLSLLSESTTSDDDLCKVTFFER